MGWGSSNFHAAANGALQVVDPKECVNFLFGLHETDCKENRH
jgi:hypothetical protein